MVQAGNPTDPDLSVNFTVHIPISAFRIITAVTADSLAKLPIHQQFHRIIELSAGQKITGPDQRSLQVSRRCERLNWSIASHCTELILACRPQI